nr:MAG TPA: hypothetical protein [Caudoviricetes sp.]
MPPVRGRYLSASAFVDNSLSILLTVLSIFLLIPVMSLFILLIEISIVSILPLVYSYS